MPERMEAPLERVTAAPTFAADPDAAEIFQPTVSHHAVRRDNTGSHGTGVVVVDPVRNITMYIPARRYAGVSCNVHKGMGTVPIVHLEEDGTIAGC